jgi:pimeloyl-ACP methyl ester carboxylesterase
MTKEIYGKHHMLTLAGGPVSVYESGGNGFPPVLLLHGAMYDESRLIWHNLAPVLAETMHVFAIDFPRHGSSRPWKGNVSKELLDGIVDRAIDFFRLAPVALIGLSMGGGVSIEYMLNHQDKVKCAVLMGPGGLGDRVNNQFWSWLFTKIPGALTALTKYYGRLSDEKFRGLAKKILHDGDTSRDFEVIVGLMKEEARRKAEAMESSMDDWQTDHIAPFKLKINYLPELHRIQVPLLWMRGEEDPLVGHEQVAEAARKSPNSEFVEIKGAGHLLPLEQPEEVNAQVLAFLQKSLYRGMGSA